MIANVHKQSVTEEVVEALIENFECQPVLFVGSGLTRRYLSAPDWEGTLRAIHALLPKDRPTYEYLSQKNERDLVAIGSDLTELVFEWAWNEGKSKFPEELYGSEHKSSFIKYLIAEIFSSLTPKEVFESVKEYKNEFIALRSIRPHAIITTNYDNMLESLFTGYEAIIGKQVLRYNLNAYGEVYHIHGNVDSPNTIVINKEDYDKWGKESKYFAAKLLTYFAEHPIIIFGYSLTDSNVRIILEDIGQIVADETGLIANVIQVIYDSELQDGAIQTEVSIPSEGNQFRIKALRTNSLLEVFQALTARHELKDVNPALVRALAARAMKLTRSDIPNGNIEVDYHTLEGIVDSEDKLPTLLGITHADDVNKSHPYTLSIVGEKLGYSSWNGANKLIEKVKSEKGLDIKASDNRYHCAVKVGKKDSSISRKYSDALVALLGKVRDGQKYQVKL
ncbi:SIR2 family protein [Sphingobium sp. B11D3D]|uniref:SIR2 family protein n=1 Tax=Sphingobium sp. B11D3D TaxID=2940576 RepID=UPI002224AB7D|nr:SIR2 family protein [Sphingobium sp. B11D3D]MCW2370422.1 hypothetical protein [Sphingobium sp. B11D3D]